MEKATKQDMHYISCFILFLAFQPNRGHLIRRNIIFESTPGYRLSNDVISVDNVNVIEECSLLCVADSRCASFNIVAGDNGEKQCQLNSNSPSGLLLVDGDSTYYGKDY